jgi:replicative DNA helicase
MDTELLHILRNQVQYNRFRPYVKEHVLSPEATIIINMMGEYFKTYPACKEIDWPTFRTWFLVLRNSTMDKDSLLIYRRIFDTLVAGVPSTTTMDEVLRHYVTLDYTTRIANKCLSNDTDTIDRVRDMCTEYDRELGRALNLSDLFVSENITSTLKSVSEPGLPWRLNELNISCGPLRQGDFVIIGARPETGKTTFLAAEVSNMAAHIPDDRPVVWVNNEERSDKVMLRIQQATLGIGVKDIQADPAKAMADYQAIMRIKNRILVTGSNAGLNSADALTSKFRELKPALIVFDQLDKVEGFARKSDKEDQRLGDLYLWARQLAHEYGPVITASQASDSAEGQQWIYQNQLRGSRTDKPGEADLIITIGKVHDPLKENTRYIHVAKNKLFGGPVSEEKERHGYWEVTIKPHVARYVGTR